MYAYCRNNPVCRIDITGYADEEADLNGDTKDDLFPNPMAAPKTAGEPAVGSCTGSSAPSNNAYDPYQAQLDGGVPSYDCSQLPRQGLVTGDPNAPPVDAGKQGKHVEGHNNFQKGKSSWPAGRTGVSQTQEAWMNGVNDPSKPGQSVRIGLASDGTIVRVHMAGNGAIHGYPIGNAISMVFLDMY